MTHSYQVTIKQQLLVLTQFIILNTAVALIFCYLSDNRYAGFVTSCFLGFLIALYVLPVLILHTQYLLKNIGAAFFIDVIVVTCLMMNNIEFTLERLIQVEAKWKFRGIPLIYQNVMVSGSFWNALQFNH